LSSLKKEKPSPPGLKRVFESKNRGGEKGGSIRTLEKKKSRNQRGNDNQGKRRLGRRYKTLVEKGEEVSKERHGEKGTRKTEG